MQLLVMFYLKWRINPKLFAIIRNLHIGLFHIVLKRFQFFENVVNGQISV